MPQVTVLSQHADRFAQLINDAKLPDITLTAHNSPATALPSCAGTEILFGAPDLLSQVVAHCPQLQWVQSSWAGVEPLVTCPHRNYILTGLKDVFGQQMSEYVIGWILALQRNILSRSVSQRWEPSPDDSVAGKEVGILGTGSIASQVAKLCREFSMTVRGFNSDGRPQAHFDRCYTSPEIGAFAQGLDFLVCLLPDTHATNNLVNTQLLGRLQPGAVVINAGRANCIEHNDLLQALQEGILSAAVLDVTPEEPLPENHPMWNTPQLYITSHTAAPTRPEPIVQVFCDNYRRYQAGEALYYGIDFDRGY
jgi:phosphoglycerate dehydrogenase-like enzyme